MGRMEEWAEGLRYESLRQAADTFFGARKAVERDRALLMDWAQKVHRISQKLETWTAALNCVLGGEANTRALLERLGVRLPEARLYEVQACLVQFSRPHSFTRQGLYCKIVWAVYEHWADTLREYHHGRPYPDPSLPGRVLHTPGYQQVLSLCAELNARIEHINAAYRPSESLEFARRLDPAAQDKASILGCGAELCSLDASLALPLVDPASLGLLPWPQPPAEEAARRAVKELCQRIYREQREVAESVLESAFRGADKHVCHIGNTAEAPQHD